MDDYKLNEHWKVIASGGNQISNTPQSLWEAAVMYFKWCDDNPITAKKTLTSGKTQGDKVTVEFKRPYSIKGFCLHTGINEAYINDIKDSYKKDSEYYMIMEKILMIIYTQNLEGALVDLYNPIMVSKVLNMDRQSDNEGQTTRVEIVDSTSTVLATNENQILQNLNPEKVNLLKDKVEDPSGNNTHAHPIG